MIALRGNHFTARFNTHFVGVFLTVAYRLRRPHGMPADFLMNSEALNARDSTHPPHTGNYGCRCILWDTPIPFRDQWLTGLDGAESGESAGDGPFGAPGDVLSTDSIRDSVPKRRYCENTTSFR